MGLTKEERQERREARKLAKARKAEEKRIKLRREFLEREFVLGKINTEALKKRWHKMCMDARVPQIKDDMQVMWHWFERTIDLKDDTIINLLEELADAEVQYSRACQNHAEYIDKFIVYFTSHIDSVNLAYQTELEELMNRMKVDTAKLRSKQDYDEDYLNTIMFTMEKNEAEADVFLRSENISKMDEEVNKNVSDLDLLRSLLEKQFENLWNSYKSTLTNYERSTDERRKEYLVLKEKDDRSARLIEKQMIKMNKLIEDISLKREQLLNIRSAKREFESLQTERTAFHDAFWAMKDTLSKQMKHDDFQFQTLAINSDLSMQSLHRVLEKGKRILKIGAACSTLETEQERVMPFSSQTLPEEISKEKSNLKKLGKFWLRVGNVDYSRMQLTALLNDLKTENQYLKNVLVNALGSFRSSV